MPLLFTNKRYSERYCKILIFDSYIHVFCDYVHTLYILVSLVHVVFSSFLLLLLPLPLYTPLEQARREKQQADLRKRLC